MTNQEKLQQVIDNDLCTRCGSCVGLGKGSIEFKDKTGRYLPGIKGQLNAKDAKEAWSACSGQEVNFPALDSFLFNGEGNHHKYFGTYRELNIGFTTNFELRRRCGSAGVITSTLIWLLEEKMIQGAVVLGMSEKEPWLTKPFIATSKEDVIKASQSKYVISSVNELLPEMEAFHGNLAYVGLPCQVHSIRKLQKENHPSVKNIKYIIAPYCGLNLHFSSIKSFLRSHGKKNYKDIADIKFRHGEWPGNMRVEMKDGSVFQLPKFHSNYLIPFHMMKRCLVCVDVANEFTDISVGDAWAPVYEERGKGFSIVIGRSEKGVEILHKMKEEGIIDLIPVNVEDTVRMHSHMYDNKKRGAFLRIRKRRYQPDYNLPFPEGIGFKRRFFEFAMNIIMAILRTRFVTSLVDILPSNVVGKTFNSFKIFWKRITYTTKRKDL
ncbi:MAG: Coenzyme F420 hydrogenase/dehydrogenase, beta subunit C-terminal domain [Bacteroidales bacterium]|nr:Coenzyme F420 hydrogenase/dehydrogenase, beta subunit C-terminal domain [Bacteroidales bacterium]